jgi:hypothetical protein
MDDRADFVEFRPNSLRNGGCSDRLKFVPSDTLSLTTREKFRLVEIANETKYSSLRDMAMRVLQEALAPAAKEGGASRQRESMEGASHGYTNPPTVLVGPKGMEKWWPAWCEKYPMECPRIKRDGKTVRWTPQKPKTNGRLSSCMGVVQWVEPEGWQGGYVNILTDIGCRFWLFEEFWDWVDHTDARPEEIAQ